MQSNITILFIYAAMRRRIVNKEKMVNSGIAY